MSRNWRGFYKCFTPGNPPTGELKRVWENGWDQDGEPGLDSENGDYEVEVSFIEHEVTSSLASEWHTVTTNGNSSQIRDETDSEEHAVWGLAMAPLRWTMRGCWEKKLESQESTDLWTQLSLRTDPRLRFWESVNTLRNHKVLRVFSIGRFLRDPIAEVFHV